MTHDRPVGSSLRAWASITAVAAITIIALTAIYPPARGVIGYGTVGASSSSRQIAQVVPNSAAAASGIRIGDRIAAERLTPSERIALRYPTAGRQLRLAIERDGRIRVVTLTPRSASASTVERLQKALVFLYVLIALLVAWKAADRRLAIPIVAFLTGWVLNHVIYYLSTIISDSMLAYLIRDWLWSTASILWLGGLLAFITTFPEPVSLYRRTLGSAARWIVAAQLMVYALRDLNTPFPGLSFVVGGHDVTTILISSWFIFLNLACIFAIIDGWRTVDPKSRPAALWTGSGLMLFFGLALAFSTLNSLNIYWRSGWFGDLYEVQSLAGVGIAYAVLRHRVADLQVVVSRAAIFSIVSIALILLFISAEWLFQKLIEGALGTTRSPYSTNFVAIAVALGVGLLANRIHQVIEHHMNRVFFRRRYRAVAELHRLALAIDAATSADAVLDRTFEALRYYLDSSAVAIYIGDPQIGYRCARHDDSGFPSWLDANEEVVLRLRRWAESCVIENDRHPFDHAFVSPMSLRGTLFGFIVCGRKRDRTAYLEDECTSITTLVHHVGVAYEWLARPTDGPSELRVMAARPS